jgi:uncharacterized protein YkwD
MLAVAIRRRRAGWLALLLAASIAFTALPSQPAQARATLEGELQTRHNHARWTREIRRLTLSASLSQKAERHSRAMAARGYIYHSRCLTCVFSGYSWSVGGENVGVGASIRSLHRAFMDSPPHRRNVLYRSYRYVGIGVVRSGGRLWVTVLFMG